MGIKRYKNKRPKFKYGPKGQKMYNSENKLLEIKKPMQCIGYKSS